MKLEPKNKTDETVLELSALVLINSDISGAVNLVTEYLDELSGLGRSFELLCVFDRQNANLAQRLKELAKNRPEFIPLEYLSNATEDRAFKYGISKASGDLILTLPGWREVQVGEIPKLFEAYVDSDLVCGVRTETTESGVQKLRKGILQTLVKMLFRRSFSDMFCRLRLGQRQMFQDILDVGVRQHFVPLLAVSDGYKITETALTASPTQPFQFKLGGHIAALIDVVTLYVGLNFLRRPMRFFGAVGIPMALVGLLITAYLVIARLFFGVGLADRPALVFAVLLIVLGIQIVALGLIGEIIIFASTKRLKSYDVETTNLGD